MPSSHAVSALTQKHAEIQGEVMTIEKQLEQLNEQLSALEISIQIFEPDFRIQDIRAKRTNQRTEGIRKGEVSEMVGNYVRLSEQEFTVNDLIKYVFDLKPELQPSFRPSIKQAVSKVLRRFENRNIIQAVGKGVSQGSPIIWRSVS